MTVRRAILERRKWLKWIERASQSLPRGNGAQRLASVGQKVTAPNGGGEFQFDRTTRRIPKAK